MAEIRINRNPEVKYAPELYHYASKYYDPVKAHEYYEQHKQLKGRAVSTKGPSVKDNTMSNESNQAKISDARNEVTKGTTNMMSAKQRDAAAKQQRIDRLKDILSRMDPETRKLYSKSFQNIISRMRSRNKDSAKATKTTKSQSTSTSKTQIAPDTEKYEDTVTYKKRHGISKFTI